MLGAIPNGISDFLLSGESLSVFQKDNKDLIDEDIVRIADKFNVDVEFFDGDFGTLLSNLVDNAIEACEKVKPERRYINLIIKVVEENMFIHIENSKISAPIDINVSTKDNPDSHGIGVARVKEIFDKYDGKVKFEQEEDRFVVKGFLNCKNWCQGIA